jgi:hypothetical protein
VVFQRDFVREGQNVRLAEQVLVVVVIVVFIILLVLVGIRGLLGW